MSNGLRKTVNLEWPYVMQPHPEDPNLMGTQQLLERVLSPGAPYKRIGFGGPKGGGKCLINSTLISLKDGSKARIDSIKKGDEVLSITEDGRIQPRRVTEIFVSEKKTFYRLRTKTGLEIEAGCTHKLKTDTGWVRVDQLSEGGFVAVDRSEVSADQLTGLVTNDIFWDQIESITPIGTEIGYDFEVQGNHNYIANGIVSHNSYGARGISFTLTYEIPIVIVIVRSRLNTLKRNHIIPAKNELRDWLDEEIIDYNEKDKIFYMPSGGMVQFMHCAKESDVEQFDGVSADLYIFEEAGHFTKSMIDGIIKNNRSSDIAINRGAVYPPRSLFTFNWGGPGHSILRRWFWDRVYTEYERKEDFFFIFASLEQNRALLNVNPEYVRNLQQLPKQLREAYLTGDPDAFVGTMFMVIPEYHEVDADVLLEPYNQNVPLAEFTIPESWRIVGSIDAGIGAPCSFGLYAITPEGKLYKIFTYYDVKPSAPLHVNAIMDRIEACRFTRGAAPEFIVADVYAFQKHNQMGLQAGDVTWEDLFAKHSIPLHPVKYNRITAIMALQTSIHFELDENNRDVLVEPKLQFFAGYNDNTIEEMRAVQRSKTNPEDIEENAVDHAIDETKNMVLCAESPPDYVPLKDVPKVSRKADYGSQIDRLKELQDMSLNDRYRETFRNAL